MELTKDLSGLVSQPDSQSDSQRMCNIVLEVMMHNFKGLSCQVESVIIS